MENIVFLDRETIAPQITLPTLSCEHQWQDYPQTAVDELLPRLADATIVVNNKVPLRAETLSLLPKLKLIAVAATGVDCLDSDYCRDNGIAIANIRGYSVNTVPEHALMLMLALKRSLPSYQQDVKGGEWQKSGQFCFHHHPINDLSGSTLALVGSGTIGDRVRKLAEAFGMRVILAERKNADTVRPGYVAWRDALGQADVISIHCPLTPETRHLFDDEAFSLMKNTATLINTARGHIVNEEALENALLNGQIASAGFDVAEVEPAPDDSRLLKLTRLSNFILTPHTAWASTEAQQTLANQLIDNIDAFLQGKSQNRVV